MNLSTLRCQEAEQSRAVEFANAAEALSTENQQMSKRGTKATAIKKASIPPGVKLPARHASDHFSLNMDSVTGNRPIGDKEACKNLQRMEDRVAESGIVLRVIQDKKSNKNLSNSVFKTSMLSSANSSTSRVRTNRKAAARRSARRMASNMV